ncbi:MAG: antitoxin PHD [Actinobacteria bacterium HGW-Actinobacteria-4]|nr:MAG: antitoxin PHD [Actinobacteria bacterium HGW-Actinobacteria-4]
MPAREFRIELADVVNRVGYSHQRVAITRHGKVAAVLIGPDDLALLEQLEMARDVEEYRAAKAADDGDRIPLEDLEKELA